MTDREVLLKAAEIIFHSGWQAEAAVLRWHAKNIKDSPQPPGRLVRIAVAGTQHRFGLCWISEQTSDSDCLATAGDEAVGSAIEVPITHLAIITAVIPHCRVPVVEGTVEEATT